MSIFMLSYRFVPLTFIVKTMSRKSSSLISIIVASSSKALNSVSEVTVEGLEHLK